MDTKYSWTVDVESDFGGRSETTVGLEEGLPFILETFRANNIKALFFVSSELMKFHHATIDQIAEKGHEIGSHGHFHIKFKDKWRAFQDKEISETLLQRYKPRYYRAPKFSFSDGREYASPKNHVGLLKSVWFGLPKLSNQIIYLHPFDLIKGFNSPNLFCKVWYSRYQEARTLFIKLAQTYTGAKRLI